MANRLTILLRRRTLVLLALVVLSVVLGRCGHPFVGMWDGPAGGDHGSLDVALLRWGAGSVGVVHQHP